MSKKEELMIDIRRSLRQCSLNNMELSKKVKALENENNELKEKIAKLKKSIKEKDELDKLPDLYRYQ